MLRMTRLFACVSVIFALSSTCVQLRAATIIHVPADQPTIQAAISAATNGDTVQVAPGTYVENLSFMGKAITVTSEQGRDVTIIDGNAAGAVVTFASGEGRQSVLDGFTLRNGKNSSGVGGGGVSISTSSPTIIGNFITNNSAANGGGGIGINFGSPLVQGNVIKNNRQMTGYSGGVGGGGIMILGPSSAQILNNDISNNSWSSSSGGGLSLFGAGTPTIQNNIVSFNSAYSSGGGFSIVNQSDASIVQNVIVGNTAPTGAGVYSSVPYGTRGSYLINNTIYANNGSQGSGVFSDGFHDQALLVNNVIMATAGQTAVMCSSLYDPNPPTLQTNDVYSSSGAAFGGTCTNQTGINGNISVDPLFVNAGTGDYHLQHNSPAIDAGTNGAPAPTTDISGVSRPLDGNGDGTAVIDLGVYEAPTVDQTNPATLATLLPAPSITGWNTTSVTVTLNATDNPGGTGIQSITYSLSGAQVGGPVTTGNPAVVSITAEGTTTLSYAATDNSGNIEATKFLTVKIDRTAPVTAASTTPAPVGGWNASIVTVTLSATDNPGGSGVQNISYSSTGAQYGSNVVAGNPASVAITFEGITNLNYAASDPAGNMEQPKSAPIKIDLTGPTISGMPAPGCTLGSPNKQLVQVAVVTAADALSGVASLNVTASSNEPDSGTSGSDAPGDIVINGGTVFLRAERSPSGTGRIYTIVATAKDVAGNTSTVTSTCTVPRTGS